MVEMKNPMFAYFDLHFDLGWHHFALTNIYEHICKDKRTPIEIMIDDALGYEKEQEYLKLALKHLRAIVRIKQRLLLSGDYQNSDLELSHIKSIKAYMINKYGKPEVKKRIKKNQTKLF